MKGQSVVTTWSKSGKRSIFTVYVLSKSGQFEMLETLENLRNFGIRGKIKGDKLVIINDINSIDQYLVLRPLLSNKKKYFLILLKYSFYILEKASEVE